MIRHLLPLVVIPTFGSFILFMTNQRIKKKAREAVIKPPHEPFLIIAEANVQFKSLRMCHIRGYQTSLFLAVF